MNNNQNSYKQRLGAFIRLAISAVLLAVVVFAVPAMAGRAYADTPARVIHQVTVGEGDNAKTYCFFATNNVVLTKGDIANALAEAEKEKNGGRTKPSGGGNSTSGDQPWQELTPEEKRATLDALILQRAAVYMKEPNCNDTSHAAISQTDWENNLGTKLFVDMDDKMKDEILSYDPEKKGTIKYYTNVACWIGNKSYTTYRPTSPDLLLVIIASDNDAKLAEAVCAAIEEGKAAAEAAVTVPEKKIPDLKKIPDEEKEDLPEYKTINMVNRSGGPLEETLKDGSPVELTWIDPGKRKDADSGSFISKIPGGWVTIGLIAAAVAGIIAFLISRKKEEEAEEEYEADI